MPQEQQLTKQGQAGGANNPFVREEATKSYNETFSPGEKLSKGSKFLFEEGNELVREYGLLATPLWAVTGSLALTGSIVGGVSKLAECVLRGLPYFVNYILNNISDPILQHDDSNLFVKRYL